MKHFLFLICCLWTICSTAQAPVAIVAPEDSAVVIHAAEVYIGKQYRQHQQYQHKVSRSQQRLLRRLQRREARLARKIQRSDSALYVRYRKLSSLSFDSLARIAGDSATMNRLSDQKPVKALDSLRKIQSFVQEKAGWLKDKGISVPGMDQLNTQLNAQDYIRNQLKQRKDALASLLKGSPLASKLGGLNRTYGYGMQQMQYWKKIVQDPDEAEQKALEYLQGIEGFNELLSRSATGPGMNGQNLSAAELEQMGYQTKASVNAALQQQFGSQLQQVQQQAAQQVKEYSKQLGADKYIDKAQQAAQSVKDAKSTLKETQSSLKEAKKGLKNTKNELKNPMRGIPFWHRWEYQYNFQSLRASADGQRPVMVQAGINAAYRHSPRWSLGIGLDGSLGLGRDWQHLKLSYEGLTARVFLDGKLVWGISVQGGYEKSLRPLNRPYVQLQERYGNASNLKTAMGLLQDAAYLGLMKTYRINRKQQGTFLIGYNFLNDKTGINSPWIVRLGYKL